MAISIALPTIKAIGGAGLAAIGGHLAGKAISGIAKGVSKGNSNQRTWEDIAEEHIKSKTTTTNPNIEDTPNNKKPQATTLPTTKPIASTLPKTEATTKPKGEKGDKNGNEEEEKTPIPIILPSDNPSSESNNSTSEYQNNISTEFLNAMNEIAKQNQRELWQREDMIRYETQEREDNAYQRMVADMKKAGINVNLATLNPSASGGGITNATAKESILGNEISSITNQLINEIQNDTTIDQAEKDRILNLIGTVIKSIVNVKIAGSLGKIKK